MRGQGGFQCKMLVSVALIPADNSWQDGSGPTQPHNRQQSQPPSWHGHTYCFREQLSSYNCFPQAANWNSDFLLEVSYMYIDLVGEQDLLPIRRETFHSTEFPQIWLHLILILIHGKQKFLEIKRTSPSVNLMIINLSLENKKENSIAGMS